MVIAITGGSGFIGSLITQNHVMLGHEVRVFSRKVLTKQKNIRYFFGDLSEPDVMLSDFLHGVDIFYNCAGEIKDKSLMYKLHVNGTQKLVNMAKGKIGRWIQLSSVGVYGRQRNGIISENSLEKPVGIYEQTKAISDRILINSGIPYVIVRPSIVFGKGMTNQSLKNLLHFVQKGIFFYIGKKDEFLVNYVHLDDVVSFLMFCGTNIKAEGEIFILSQSTSVENMIKSFMLETQNQKNIIRLPEFFVRTITSIFEIIPKFPLTYSKIDALTNKCVYNSTKLHNILNFNFLMTLEERFKSFANQK